jgi:hypothetical protein
MKLLKAVILGAGIVVIAGAGPALAAGLTPAQCQQLEREYSRLQQKEQNGTATPADKRRMKQIDDQTNIYCS